MVEREGEGSRGVLAPFNSLVLETVTVSKAFVVVSTAAMIAVEVLMRSEPECDFVLVFKAGTESPSRLKAFRDEASKHRNLELVGLAPASMTKPAPACSASTQHQALQGSMKKIINTMFPSIIRRTAQQKIPFDVYANPYKAKRLWPPDFSKISPKHQFRLERKYKRRAKLKWARPRWTKAVKIAQLGSIVCG
jgi:hypothetical protein